MIVLELTEENLKGKIYNNWEIISFDYKIKYNKYFKCRCLICGKEKTILIQNVIHEKSKSCGCISKKWIGELNKKRNQYYINNNIVNVTLSDNKSVMICDTEDWKRLEDFCWSNDGHGYAIAYTPNGFIRFHRKIMNIKNAQIQVDHINGNRLDNRKQNLRLCSNQENSFNKYQNSNNTSGYKGVYYDKERNKWRGAIQYNGKSLKSSKRYDKPEDAYEWYIKKSNELFGYFSVFESRE